MILKHICHGNDDSFHIVDLVTKKNIAFEVKTAYLGGDVISVESDNYIFFDINNKYGVYDNGFDEGYYLSESEMSEALNSNAYIKIFSEYYGKIYPKLLETLQGVKSHTKVRK